MDHLSLAVGPHHPLAHLPTPLERAAQRREACEALAIALRKRPQLELVAHFGVCETTRMLELTLRGGEPGAADYLWIHEQLDALRWSPDFLRCSRLTARHDYLYLRHQATEARVMLAICKTPSA